MKNKQLIIVYILLIAVQLLHAFEEFIGKAYFINTIYKGTTNFFIIQIIFFFIPIILLSFSIKGSKKAKTLSYLYAWIIVIDGLWHLITHIPGVYTSVGLVVLGLLLIYFKFNEEVK